MRKNVGKLHVTLLPLSPTEHVSGAGAERERSISNYNFSHFFHIRWVAILTTAIRRGFALYEYILVLFSFLNRNFSLS